MEETVYLNTVVQRGITYVIRIINRGDGHYITLTGNQEKFRDILISGEVTYDRENFSASAIFKEIIEAEERWVADNR